MPAHLHADVRDSSIIDEMIVSPIKSLCHSGKMKRPHQYQTQEDQMNPSQVNAKINSQFSS